MYYWYLWPGISATGKVGYGHRGVIFNKFTVTTVAVRFPLISSMATRVQSLCYHVTTVTTPFPLNSSTDQGLRACVTVLPLLPLPSLWYPVRQQGFSMFRACVIIVHVVTAPFPLIFIYVMVRVYETWGERGKGQPAAQSWNPVLQLPHSRT